MTDHRALLIRLREFVKIERDEAYDFCLDRATGEIDYRTDRRHIANMDQLLADIDAAVAELENAQCHT